MTATAKFNVGDKVIFVGGIYKAPPLLYGKGIYHGEIYTVEKISGDKVRVNGVSFYVDSKYFTLAEEQKKIYIVRQGTGTIPVHFLTIAEVEKWIVRNGTVNKEHEIFECVSVKKVVPIRELKEVTK